MGRAIGVLLDGRAQPTGIRRRGTDVTMLLLMNSYHEAVVFNLPKVVGGQDWRILVDTNEPERIKPRAFRFDHEYIVTGRSLLLFKLEKERLRGRR